MTIEKRPNRIIPVFLWICLKFGDKESGNDSDSMKKGF